MKFIAQQRTNFKLFYLSLNSRSKTEGMWLHTSSLFIYHQGDAVRLKS
jgi:hypothetical protein